MPIEPLKPPDPLIEEFCTLTGMSSEGLKHVPIDMSSGNKASKPRGRPKGVNNRVNLKSFSPGSASVGAGAIFKRLRNSKVDGRGRSRSESSPMVLDKIAFDKKISSQMVFREGIIDCASTVKNDKKNKSHCAIDGNDGSFINCPIEPVVSDMEVNRDSVTDKVDCVEVNVDPMVVSNNSSKLNMAAEEHGKVENVRKSTQGWEGAEDRELQMQFVPQFVSTQSDGTKRIAISVEDIKKGSEACKIMSGIGKPMLMDKLTRERCLKKSGKLDFARVLVEVSASDELHLSLEIEYPVLGDRPGRIGKLEVKYQWKPPQCSHCKTFGHSTALYKVRPRTNDEIAAKVLKEALKVNKDNADTSVAGKVDNEGFVTVGKNNKPVGVATNVKQNSNFRASNTAQSRGFMGGNRYYGYGSQKFGNKGPNQQNRSVNGGSSKNQSSFLNAKVNGGNASEAQKTNVKSAPDGLVANKGVKKKGNDKTELVSKPALMSKYNANYQPKVLVRGSSSKMTANVSSENIPISNSYQALEDQDMAHKEESFLNSMDEEFLSSVWPKLKSEVEEVLQSAINGNHRFFCSFFYAHYKDAGRKPLWNDLVKHSIVVKDEPWVLLGDFNVILEPSERSFGSSSITSGMEEFRSCIDKIECSLCNSVMDNHNHLFFDCDFSSKVWNYFKGLMRFEDAPDNLFTVIDLISTRTMGKSIWSIIQRLVLGAVVYHLWIERNNRIFQNKSRNIADICNIVREAVRLRLLSLKIKGSKRSLDASRIWNFQVMKGNDGK
ncbi:hypothetical protein CTI12_AA034600 [Artemisia annua]|uniref:RNA-directed DNA polymerase, eukaryota, Reverse transcriptase zinc-binding domain protein n=1 Tax=Artemisia annua TaxID=35608 RepID=A0A2U1PU99_ARTAN|nr:hypothetical protein CTI12_AA034600 [Artemisia annua]